MSCMLSDIMRSYIGRSVGFGPLWKVEIATQQRNLDGEPDQRWNVTLSDEIECPKCHTYTRVLHIALCGEQNNILFLGFCHGGRG